MAGLQPDTPLQFIKGVGPRRAEALASLGLHTVRDLLHYFPFRHEHQLGVVDIADLELGTNATIRGSVTRVSSRRGVVLVEVHDGTARCTLRWFHQPYRAGTIRRDAVVVATGRVGEYRGEPELAQPTVQVFGEGASLDHLRLGARLVGVYAANQQCPSALVRRTASNALQSGPLPVVEWLPEPIRSGHRLLGLEAAIRAMHEPADEAELQAARRRLAFDEFFLLETAMALRRRRALAQQRGARIVVTPEIDARIRARFPFSLTAAQDGALREITRDMSSGRPMTRLLQGDVGSGKTVVALYACLAAIASGRQAAIMGPTEVLVRQHYANIEKYLAGSRVRRALLAGAERARRAETLSAVARGEIDLVVGTQALLERDVAFHRLGLVVVDEQHKFGVMQRSTIRTKSATPHMLVMTATPIPRSLAMTVFGDLDVSVLDASPPGRQPVATRVVAPGQWATVMSYARKRLEAGEQAFVVCPLIGEEDAADSGEPGRGSKLLSATRVFEMLSEGPWRGLRVGLLHGSMRSGEKSKVMDAFAANRLHAVVATTVVEVGVDVPNATIMIVENAERFGLSQLHQLRGRVGRGSAASLCVLVNRGLTRAGAERGGSEGAASATTKGDDRSSIDGWTALQPGAAPSRSRAAERLAVLAATTDGFRIAEADLRLRGPGELFGTRQHGLPELRIGDLVRDFELLATARREAFELIARDPQLAAPQHSGVAAALREMFGGKMTFIDAG